jgi:hypothetical protein
VDLAKGFDQGSAEIQNLIGSDHPSAPHRVTFANFPDKLSEALAYADDNRAPRLLNSVMIIERAATGATGNKRLALMKSLPSN